MRSERKHVGDVLRRETVGGALMLATTVAALAWANSGWSAGYSRLIHYAVGPQPLRLHLTVAEWASDGLLAIFFFVAGLELKHEFTAGQLREPRRAALPVAAAVGGMAAPALLYLAVTAGDSAAARGWAIPSATDIAFALAVLAIIGAHLPSALRTFLLTLAVVDDLLAIAIIALFYTAGLELWPLFGALAALVLFALLIRSRFRRWWLLTPLALLAWGLVHASGVHATVAGVLLGFAVPALPRRGDGSPTAHRWQVESLAHRWRPISATVAVPVFAFCSVGVVVGGWSGLGDALSDRIAIGIVAGLVVGKTIGIFATAYLLERFTGARLHESIRWRDLLGLAVLGGIGFTVSLLIGELAFGDGTSTDDHVKVAILTGSVLSALIATVVLRDRGHRRRGRVVTQVAAMEDPGPARQ